jgi:hypothetical protein
LSDILTNPYVLAAISGAIYLIAKKSPGLGAALKSIFDALTKKSSAVEALASADAPESARCEVLKGIRHQISEQPDPEQRAKDLALCDEFRGMLKRLSEPKVAA